MDIGSYDPATAGRGFDPDTWRRSSWCGPDQGDCVEVNFGKPGFAALRDSKLADSPVLLFTAGEWDSFLRGLGGLSGLGGLGGPGSR
jgi:hypothetical protein